MPERRPVLPPRHCGTFAVDLVCTVCGDFIPNVKRVLITH